MPGNRYAAAMDPQAGGPPDAAPQPPMDPSAAPPPGAPQVQSGAPNPALVEALQILEGHEGKVADLLKDPEKVQHVRVLWDAIKQDPKAIQSLQQAGIGPEKLQMFDQMLTQAEQSGKTQAAPHWLAR